MSNGTSSSSSSLSSTLIPTSTSTASTTTSSSPKATITPAGESGTDTGLSGSQIGGIVGGVVGGVLVFAVVGLVLFLQRRKGGESGAGGASESAGDLDETVGLGKDVPMLGGSMRQEMDAQGGAVLHEMEGVDRVLGTGSGEKGISELEGERTVVAELDGRGVVRPSGG
ncbi:hypothetical protein ETB97_002715 [Aspergillus alliaceus]|uniref:Uncharacterized protein n=1 Tax=Petromyces alliaceus TaxID=209559 RepID=A0A8H6AEH0_PETAA|nr:hypothetical protein ETB97_002715 [Aspergillus burnettii]